MKQQRKKNNGTVYAKCLRFAKPESPFFNFHIYTHTKLKKIHSTQQVALQASKLPHDNGGKININGNVVMFDVFWPSFDRRLSNG